MPTTITALPPAPSRADPTTFSSKADTFVAALPTMVTEINALSLELNTASSDAISSAATATTQAGIATTQAGIATTQAGIATTAAASAINSPATNAISSTSLVIGNGVKTFTIQTGKDFAVGQTVVLASSANPLNQMVGIITAHNPATGVMDVTVANDTFNGSGAYADWVVALTAPPYATPQIVNLAANSAAVLAADYAQLLVLALAKKD